MRKTGKKMYKYYLSKIALPNGKHEVHKEGCFNLPEPEDRIDLGYHTSCIYAIRKAKRYFKEIDGCFYCNYECYSF